MQTVFRALIATAFLCSLYAGAAYGEDEASGLPLQLAQSESGDPDASEEAEPGTVPDDALPKVPEISEPSEDAEKPASEGGAERRVSDGPLPEVHYDVSKLPEPVRRMRELILEAAKSGDLEKLRDLIGIGDSMTTLSFGGLEGDPIEFLRESSGDKQGFEVLAILIEVLEAGYVHLDPGSDDEIYAWPYFFAWPLERLSPQQRVELFRVLTAGDVEDSENFGGYIFYRVGIKPDGTWHFFVAGD